jgi:hypothetical protein
VNVVPASSHCVVKTVSEPVAYICVQPKESVLRQVVFLLLFIGIVGGGVQLDPLETAATSRPMVPASSDYDDGEIGVMIGKGNRSTRRKPAPVPLCPPQTSHAARTRTRAAAVGNTTSISAYQNPMLKNVF